jgi:hypothetical protein
VGGHPPSPPAGGSASNGKSHSRSQEIFVLEDENHNRRPGRDFPLLHPRRGLAPRNTYSTGLALKAEKTFDELFSTTMH